MLAQIGNAANVIAPPIFAAHFSEAERKYRPAFLKAAWQGSWMTAAELADAAAEARARRERWFWEVGTDCPALRGREQALAFCGRAAFQMQMSRIDLFLWVDRVEAWASTPLPEDGELVPPPQPEASR